MKIRRYAVGDLDSIRTLVEAVTLEVYGSLLSADFLPDRSTDWARGWVADDDGKLVGILLTGGDWVDDLWIAKDRRHHGLGTRLLALAEREIASRGRQQARLRVVSDNLAAIGFYAARGWQECRRYRHERFNFEMVEMTKFISSLPASEPDS